MVEGQRVAVRFGHLYADCVTFAEALEAVADLVSRGQGGYVVTPNVDHVILAERHAGLREAYAEAALSLADGMPLVWMARLLRMPLPEKISGSDLVLPLMQRAAADGWRVYLLGAAPGVGDAAAAALRCALPALNLVGVDAPPLGFEHDAAQRAEVVAKVRATRPHLVLVALGCPKQELFMRSAAAEIAPAVALGIGASLDFLAGRVRRAPRWMSRWGLEWLFRLAQDPRRLAARYLLRDPAIVWVFLRMLCLPRAARVFQQPSARASGEAAGDQAL